MNFEHIQHISTFIRNYKHVFACWVFIGAIISPGPVSLTTKDISNRLTASGATTIITTEEIARLVDQVYFKHAGYFCWDEPKVKRTQASSKNTMARCEGFCIGTLQCRSLRRSGVFIGNFEQSWNRSIVSNILFCEHDSFAQVKAKKGNRRQKSSFCGFRNHISLFFLVSLHLKSCINTYQNVRAHKQNPRFFVCISLWQMYNRYKKMDLIGSLFYIYLYSLCLSVTF